METGNRWLKVLESVLVSGNLGDHIFLTIYENEIAVEVFFEAITSIR